MGPDEMRICAICVICGSMLFAQDTRNVTEPVVPAVCKTLISTWDHDETKMDTARIQEAIDACPKGQAVELRGAFLSGALELRAGVTLLLSANTTLFASRNPRDFEVSEGSCGIVSQSGRGCK